MPERKESKDAFADLVKMRDDGMGRWSSLEADGTSPKLGGQMDLDLCRDLE